MNDNYKSMEVEDQCLEDPKYEIVYCNVLPYQIEFFVKNFNEFQQKIPSILDDKTVTIIKVL